MTEFNTYGWLIWYAEHRNTKIRALTWKILAKSICRPLLNNHASLIEKSISTALDEMELPVVKTLALDFINWVSEMLLRTQNCENQDEVVSLETVRIMIGKQSFLSRIKEALNDWQIPPLYAASIVRFVTVAVKADFKWSIPILTQLDLWTVLF